MNIDVITDAHVDIDIQKCIGTYKKVNKLSRYTKIYGLSQIYHCFKALLVYNPTDGFNICLVWNYLLKYTYIYFLLNIKNRKYF